VQHKLRGEGVECELLSDPSWGHAFFYMDEPSVRNALSRIVDFASRHVDIAPLECNGHLNMTDVALSSLLDEVPLFSSLEQFDCLARRISDHRDVAPDPFFDSGEQRTRRRSISVPTSRLTPLLGTLISDSS
jgi:hypothetical protein